MGIRDNMIQTNVKNNFKFYKQKRCRKIANETTAQQRPQDDYINIYMPLYGLQHLAKPETFSF